MSYTVVWEPTAEQELADIWMRAKDPAAVTSAAHQIDQLLGMDPLGEGESRDDPLRILFVEPLGVYYEVDQPGGRVEVRKVWRTRR
jgi:hypothetical protein